MDALPFSGRLGVESIRVRYVQTYQQLAYFICPKFMMPVWGRLLFNMDGLVEYDPPGGGGGGGGLAIINSRLVCYWFYLPPILIHDLTPQGDI